MSEAVEWRVKDATNAVLMAMNAVILTVSYLAVVFSLMFASGYALWVTQAVSWGFLIAALWGIVMYKANQSGGRARKVMRMLGSEYPDPPLDEWEDDLEDRGAFEVNYESE